MLFQVSKKVFKSRHNSNPKVVFVDVTYNQLFVVLLRPCLSLRKGQIKLKMRLFWKIVRKLKGRIAISIYNVKRLQKYDDSQHDWIDRNKNLLYNDNEKCRKNKKGV